MIKIIIRHEWRILVTERIVQLSVALFVAAAVLAFANSLRDLPARQIEANEAARRQNESQAKALEKVIKDEQELAQKGESIVRFKTFETSPWDLQTEIINFTAVLPPSTLALAATGESYSQPRSLSYQQYRDDSPTQPTVADRSLGNVFPAKPTQNPLSNLVGRFDLAFITLYLFPLIILALTFNLIAVEKENGTLALLLSQPVSLGQIVLGKTLLRAALVFVCGVLLPGILIALGQKLVLGDVSLWRLLLWTIAVTAYGAFWFALAIWFNSFGASAARNALTLAVCWIAFTVLIPASVNLAAQIIAPSFSKIRFADEERAARLEGNAKFYRTVNAVYEDFNRRYPRSEADSAQETERERARMEDRADLPVNEDLLPNYFAQRATLDSQGLSVNQLMFAATSAREEYIEKRLQPILRQSHKRRQQQQSIVSTLSFFSPTALLQKILTDLAGTNANRNQDFTAQFDDYVRQRNNIFFSKMISGERITLSELNSLAPFAYREEPIGVILNRTLAPTLAILFFAATLGIFGARAVSRYRLAG